MDGRRAPESFHEMLSEAVGNALTPILDCYRHRLAERPDLTGDLRLRLWVSARQVIRATPEQELSDEALQTCATGHVRRVRLPPAAPGAGAAVRLLLRFALGPRTTEPPPGVLVAEVEGPVATSGETPISVGVRIVSGPREIREIVNAIPTTAFARCLDERPEPHGAGEVELDVRIERDGTMQGAHQRNSFVPGATGASAGPRARAIVMCTCGVIDRAPLGHGAARARARIVVAYGSTSSADD